MFYTSLYRGYNQKKLTENIECEIFQVVLDQAKESYREDIVVELPNNTVEDMENNLELIKKWYAQWKQSGRKPNYTPPRSGGGNSNDNNNSSSSDGEEDDDDDYLDEDDLSE